MQEQWRTWRVAMQQALYGEGGFYTRTAAPVANFRTAAHASPLWATAFAELARRVDGSLGEPDEFAVVDVGAGAGELLAGLAEIAPARWRLLGVDIAPRPRDLVDRVEWSPNVPAGVVGLVVAVELLDVVPVDVVALTEEGPRLVEVAPDGEERPGDEPDHDDQTWLDRWWPLHEPGDRAEVGTPRDEMWAALVTRLRRGVALAVDYAVDPHRDVAGTLTGYRDGRQVMPVPDGTCDITAHVLMESCAVAAPGGPPTLMAQRDALLGLGLSGERPSYGGDPSSYLGALSAASEAGELLDAHGLGGFTWLVHAKGVPQPV